MKFLAGIFSLLLLTLNSCTREEQLCGCTPPPGTESNWKLVKLFGGWAGEERPLNNEQKNSILTIRTDGRYSCKNTVTGQISNGTLAITTVSPGLIQYVFSPVLVIYPTSSFWLNEKTETTMALGESNPDGYALTFARQ
jgi:hypothetical protein